MAGQILAGLGLEIAKPDEARDILALRGPGQVRDVKRGGVREPQLALPIE